MDSSDHNNPSKNNPSPNNQPKKGKGRQKLNMEKIENETNLQVTFSKRRAGLFKKASELSTLSGAESAVVVFSPGEKAHSFGHPNVETIANRFLNTNNAPPRNETDQLLTAQNDATMRQLNQELINVEGQLELERQRKKEHDSLRKASQSQNLCPPRNIDELNYEQLDQLKRSIMSFKHDFETKVQNATSLANSYVQGTSNPEAGIEGGAPWISPSGPNIGFPMGSNYMEGPSHFALYGNKAPLVPGGSTNPTPFHGGFVNPNVAIPTNPGSSASSVFPSSSVFVDPFGPNVGNFGFTVQYPHVAGASGSNVLLPYSTYGNPNDVVPYDVGTRSSNLEPEDSPMETQTDSE